jgi:1,4-dihydroxy-2-naphthoate octaprenyltransferase
MVYLAMGFLMTWGAYYVQLQRWSWHTLAASIPVGCLVVAILNMNNVRDYEDDLAVNKRTLPVRFGRRWGQRYHAVLLFGAYASTTVFALMGLLPLATLGVWLTFPLALGIVRVVLSATERRAFVVGIKRTSLLHLVFGMTLALCIVVATLAHWPR